MPVSVNGDTVRPDDQGVGAVSIRSRAGEIAAETKDRRKNRRKTTLRIIYRNRSNRPIGLFLEMKGAFEDVTDRGRRRFLILR